ncbi:MAG: hypothetical protein AB7T49_03640 [Oligoflexales bacterium]
MGTFPKIVNDKTDALNNRRRLISNCTSLFNIGATLWAVGCVVTSEPENLFLVGLAVAAFYIARNFCLWSLEFFYVRWFYRESLFEIENTFKSDVVSPSLRHARNSRYGAFRALNLLLKERPITSLLLTITVVANFYLVLPLVVLAYLVYLKVFALREFGELESELIKNSEAHPAVTAIFVANTQQEFNKVIQEIIKVAA